MSIITLALRAQQLEVLCGEDADASSTVSSILGHCSCIQSSVGVEARQGADVEVCHGVGACV